MTHAEARAILVAAFERVIGRPGTLPEIQALQAVASFESTYARGWKAAGQGSHNWGAITTACASGTVDGGDCLCGPGSFPYGDAKYKDGKIVGYSACFKRYETDEDGADDLVRTMFVRRPSVLAAASRGDLRGVSAAMYGYYLGTSENPDPARRLSENIAAHAAHLRTQLEAIVPALGEGLALADPPPRGSPGRSGKMLAGLILVASPLAAAGLAFALRGRS